MYRAIQLKQCVSNYSHWELAFSHFSTGKKEKRLLNFIVMNKPVSPLCNSLAPCMQARSGPTHEKQQAGTSFMLLLFNLLFHLRTKSLQLMWKPQKHEPRAKVSKICQPLAKPDTWLWKQKPAQTFSKDIKTGHGRHHRKFHREAWANAIMCEPAVTSLDWNVHEWSSSCGRKIRKKPWDGTDSKWN